MKRTMIYAGISVACIVMSVSALAIYPPYDILELVSKAEPPEYLANHIPDSRRGERSLKQGFSRSQLVALGRHLFNHETFNGNGRTCGTCHPAENNFTIDPHYIATLPKHHPLFVAENKPELAALENPMLLRELGLICENVDGFDRPCVFRSVPHTLALRTSTTAPLQNPPFEGNVLVPGTDPPIELANSTGWSGDGAPIGNGASGELRLFTVGAIIQHFPKTLNRVPGVDFRVPSALELDAILEFMLDTGRQEDFPLKDGDTPQGLVFKNTIAEFGKRVFQDQDTVNGARCSLCHDNAGANRPPTNANAGRGTLSNTRVELTVNTPAFLLRPDIPVDGGFGIFPELSPTLPPRDPLPAHGWGDGRFKAPPLIEAAVTPPYFHNNVLPTLEAAISFYASPEFNNQPTPTIRLNPDKVSGISAFLRSIGSMELIDRAIKNSQDAMATSVAFDDPFILIAIKNGDDAAKVLKEATISLYPDVQKGLKPTTWLLQQARLTPFKHVRNALLGKASSSLAALRNEIAEVE